MPHAATNIIRAAALFLAAATFISCSSGGGDSDWSEEQQARLLALAQRISGTVVYDSGGSIYKSEIGSITPILLAAGSYPRWSPDGQYVAFLQGNAVMRISAAGGQPEQIAVSGAPHALAYHPSGSEIWFTDGAAIKAAAIATRAVREIISDIGAFEFDISPDGRRLVATVRSRGNYAVVGVDLGTATTRTLDQGCSASFNPEATMVTSNANDHRQLLILDWATAAPLDRIAPADGNQYDNQFWSNSQQWVAAIGNPSGDVFVQNVADHTSVQVTAIQGCSRADLFVR